MIRDIVPATTTEALQPISESPGITESSTDEPRNLSSGSSSFLSRPPNAALEDVNAGARRGLRHRPDPHIHLGSMHIHRDGRDYDIPAARIVPGASRRGLHDLLQQGFSGPYATSGGVYYLDTRDGDIGAARRDLLNMQHDGRGRATFRG